MLDTPVRADDHRRRAGAERAASLGSMGTAQLLDYLECVKALVYPELQRIVPRGALSEILYNRMLEYPKRSAKALRPALCIASCRALGGGLDAALPTAAVLELYHNAFLVHDDIEDGSELRRDLPTLHATFGVPIAINIGDAMLALALTPLLENTRTVGLGKALRILRLVAEMARVSAEGQAMELEWIRAARFDLADDDYFDMVERKTSHYSFVTPLLAGAVLAGAGREETDALRSLGRDMGVAFQIQDDVLNLTEECGKEPDGDLYEGKHTLMLLHVLRSVSPEERRVLQAILAKPRRVEPAPSETEPSQSRDRPLERVRRTILQLAAANDPARLSSESTATLLRACEEAEAGEAEARARTAFKSKEDVAFLKDIMVRHGSIGYARAAAERWAGRAAEAFEVLAPRLRRGLDADFLRELVTYVVERSR